MSKEYTREEVAKHNTPDDLWVIIDHGVYNLSKFAKFHPGGKYVLTAVAGKDATAEFYGQHREEVLHGMGKKFLIGKVAGETLPSPPVPGTLSKVPFAESSAWLGFKTPYFKESHFRVRDAMRKFMDTEIAPDCHQLDDAGEEPSLEIYQKMGRAGILSTRVGPGPHLKMLEKLGVPVIGGVPADEFDYFHEMIVHEEISAIGTPGYTDGLGAGLVIGLPPVLHFGKPEVAMKCAKEVLLGDKRICLAISEPTAGSDVASLVTVAEKTPCGQFYIVNGIKKWITNGSFADYFVTAVRTGGTGMGGISLLLIERGEGLTTKKIKTSYSPSAGTAHVFYDNVKVPVGNLLGKENKGFQCIMSNFNHERWMIICGVVRCNRLIIEECFKWANQRKVFGKPLMQQPVIREKLAKMVAANESVHNWTENITYQMNNMNLKEQAVHLAGPIALLKYQTTRVSNLIIDEACQIFGGRAITRTGMGKVIEKFQRATKFGAILGGSEEIMADLGIRQSMRAMPPHARL
eukprot:CAMPEP_0197858532 /NCGR_PEP_ID=MMETSP1438-20131217/32387_1 /TAXON_ID=1461541 /ORGANISM="Pterosperma sp., Strain CCMP1384" /LENGTH=518 /DNA_ID=CAMNT_0043474719 /DNA_START=74 /DNA_END=1630 /DNA_ORIENTATION=-